MDIKIIARKEPVFSTGGDKLKTNQDATGYGIEVGYDELVYIQVGDKWINLERKQVSKLIKLLKKYEKLMLKDELLGEN